MKKGAKRGHSRSRVQSVYVTVRYHPVDQNRRDKQMTRTIPELTFEEVASKLWPIVDGLKEEGEERLEKME